ncbi:MAG: hypothetical protein ACKVJE_17185 [Pseudomonadales bacterium]
MKTTMINPDRKGSVRFHDAAIHVWEDDVNEAEFKHDVFKRIVQQLNRMGFDVTVPQDDIDSYGLAFAQKYRYCRKGDLEGRLDLTGRHIEFSMFQNVTNVNNSSGGQYDFDKESRMEALMLRRMNWVRTKLKTYLCNVFKNYIFEGVEKICAPGQLTALEMVDLSIKSCWHYNAELGHAKISMRQNELDRNGETITHGQPVFTIAHNNRIVTGIAMYSLNSSWYVITGKFDYISVQASNIYVKNPGSLKKKRNEELRRRRLENELSDSVKKWTSSAPMLSRIYYFLLVTSL